MQQIQAVLRLFLEAAAIRVVRSAISSITVTGGRLQWTAPVHGDVTCSAVSLLFTGIRAVREAGSPSAACVIECAKKQSETLAFYFVCCFQDDRL